MPKVKHNQSEDSSQQKPASTDLRPPESELSLPPRANTRRNDQGEGLRDSNGVYGDVHDVDHTPYGYRGYQGPEQGYGGQRLSPDERLREEWTMIKFQVFQLPNGVILHAKSEVESGAYRSKGATLVDTVYRDD